MKNAAVDEMKDPLGPVVAAATVVATWLIEPNVLLAVAAGLAVLVVKVSSAAVLHRAAGPGGRRSRLTRRQFEVAQLVKRGLTNRGIALQLAIRERTVDRHIQDSFTALGIHSRAELAAWVVEQERDEHDPPAEK